MEVVRLPSSTSCCSRSLTHRRPSLLLPARMPAGERAGGAAFGTPRCSMEAAIGGGNYSYEYVPKFPRMNIRDPYKCLGVSHDASEEEIRGARNFLLEQYAGHESSAETIEAAYEQILFTSFKERKKTKFNLKSRLRKKVVESPPWMKRLLEFVELPPTDVILRRLFSLSSWEHGV